MSLTVPPSWYPDPEFSGSVRYWDGHHWTDRRAPSNPTVVQSRGISAATVLILLVVLGALIAGGIYLWIDKPWESAEYRVCVAKQELEAGGVGNGDDFVTDARNSVIQEQCLDRFG
jgi:hypothetical protein